MNGRNKGSEAWMGDRNKGSVESMDGRQELRKCSIKDMNIGIVVWKT